MDTSIEKAYEKYLSVMQDKEMLHQCQMREMAIIDYTSGINNAIRKGEQIGLQKGLQKGIQKGLQRGIQKGIAIGEERAKQRGFQKGFQQGLQQEQTNLVLKSSQKGMPIEDIAELVDLSAEEVNNILNNNSIS
jgi:flagellar biosynthesis/type III secretory pathway protein FliH